MMNFSGKNHHSWLLLLTLQNTDGNRVLEIDSQMEMVKNKLLDKRCMALSFHRDCFDSGKVF